MCLILFAHKAHARYPLVVAANRDEAYARPAAPAAFWADHPQVYGGRDLEKGGAWLGLTTTGRFAAVTNFRDGYPKGIAPRSRGELVGNFLTGMQTGERYLQPVAASAGEFAGFCVLVGGLDALWFYSNRGNGISAVAPGIHGLSNHLLDTPWPKVVQGKEQLAAILRDGAPDMSGRLFDMLTDRSEYQSQTLPDTGIGTRRERELSPKFIAVDDRYGTRASTVIIVDRDGAVTYTERSFGARGVYLNEVTRRFNLAS